MSADALIVNKSGKREAEDLGLIPVIAEALEMGLPVLIGLSGLNGLNLAAIFEFAGEQVISPSSEAAIFASWCKAALSQETA